MGGPARRAALGGLLLLLAGGAWGLEKDLRLDPYAGSLPAAVNRPGQEALTPLLANEPVSFQFTSPGHGLSGLELALVTYARVNDSSLRISLHRLAPDKPWPAHQGRLIHQATIPAKGIIDWGGLVLHFPNERRSQGQRYAVVLEGLAAGEGNCLGLVGTSEGRYWRNGVEKRGLAACRPLFSAPPLWPTSVLLWLVCLASGGLGLALLGRAAWAAANSLPTRLSGPLGELARLGLAWARALGRLPRTALASRPQAPPASPWPGLAAMLIFSLSVVAAEGHLGASLWRQSVPAGDQSWYFIIAGSIMQLSQEVSVGEGLKLAYRLGSNFTLQYASLALLARVMPRQELAVLVVHGLWYVVAALSLWVFFWRRVRVGLLAVALTAPVLLCAPIMLRLSDGLFDLHPNILAFLLYAAALAWALASDFFRRPGAAALAGGLLAIQILARPFAGFLTCLACLPLAVAGLTRGPKEERLRAVRGLTLFAAVALALAGWWFIPRIWGFLGLMTQTTHFEGRSIWTGDLWSNLEVWLRFVREVFYPNWAYGVMHALLAGLNLAYLLYRRLAEGAWARVDWFILWMGLAPLLTLLALRSPHTLYGWPAVFGLGAFLALPWAGEEARQFGQFLRRPAAGLLLCLGAGLAMGYFLHQIGEQAEAKNDLRPRLVRLAGAIIEDAGQRKVEKITLGLVQFSPVINTPAVSHVLLFDFGCPVEAMGHTDNRLPGRPGRPRVEMPFPLVNTYYNWVAQPAPHVPKLEVAQVLAALEEKADYVICLLPESRLGIDFSPMVEAWPQWQELGRRLLASPRFRTISPIFGFGQEKVVVLRRTS